MKIKHVFSEIPFLRTPTADAGPADVEWTDSTQKKRSKSAKVPNASSNGVGRRERVQRQPLSDNGEAGGTKAPEEKVIGTETPGAKVGIQQFGANCMLFQKKMPCSF